MDVLHLYISAPITSFRVSQAREYWETYPCPPPSTVYGMLLSLVGETDRLTHQGAEIALAMVSEPQRSVVLRTIWHIKDAKVGPGLGKNKRPDFQELLTDIRLSVWVRRGKNENGKMPLVQRVGNALQHPDNVSRFGGLSLGESTQLVDEVRRWRPGDRSTGQLLVADGKGDLSLPIWPDHVGSKGTLWGQFRLEERKDLGDPGFESLGPAWVSIRPPEN